MACQELQAVIEGRKINTSLTRAAVKDTLRKIFHNLPEPRPTPMTPYEATIVERMNARVQKIAADKQVFLCMCEIAYRHRTKWFILFNTLTVANEHLHHVFKPTSKAFQTYIRKFEKTFGYSKTEKLPYFAVTEEGTKRGRLHIHVLHWFPKMPTQYNDPNIGLTHPVNRNIAKISELWPYGRSEPRMIRYHPLDAYGLLGWRWPLEEGKPLQVQTPFKLSSYLSKYIEQGYTSCQRSTLLWRVKKRHKLGHEILNELLNSLTTKTLLLLTTADNLKITINKTKAPQNLIRQNSLKILIHRRSTQHHNCTLDITEIAKQLTPALSPLHYSRASIQTIQEHNRANTGITQTLGISETDISECKKEIYKAQGDINAKYFPITLTNPGSTSTSDNLMSR